MFTFSVVVVDLPTDYILSFLFPSDTDVLVPVFSQSTDLVVVNFVVVLKFPNESHHIYFTILNVSGLNASLSRLGDVDSRMNVSKLELNCRTKQIMVRKRDCIAKTSQLQEPVKSYRDLSWAKDVEFECLNQPDYSPLRNFNSTRQKRRLEMAKTAHGD